LLAQTSRILNSVSIDIEFLTGKKLQKQKASKLIEKLCERDNDLVSNLSWKRIISIMNLGHLSYSNGYMNQGKMKVQMKL